MKLRVQYHGLRIKRLRLLLLLLNNLRWLNLGFNLQRIKLEAVNDGSRNINFFLW
jgi:hypothetical protein